MLLQYAYYDTLHDNTIAHIILYAFKLGFDFDNLMLIWIADKGELVIWTNESLWFAHQVLFLLFEAHFGPEVWESGLKNLTKKQKEEV